MNLISGYMLINKSIPSTGGPYTVRFYDEDGELIQTDTNVPQYGRASCTLLDGTFNDNLEYFKGWNPAPDSVMRDMDCYPVYGDYIISHEEIHDSWETICADKGAHYPLGAYKLLVASVPYHKYPDYVYDVRDGSSTVQARSPYLETSRVDISVEMMKVAEGEDGSTSTWLSVSPIYFGGSLRDAGSGNDSSNFLIYARVPSGGYNADFDWGACFARMFLHEMVLTNLPASLQRTIKTVNKSYWGYTPVPTIQRTVSVTLVQKTSLDKIWIPSAKELYTKLETMEKYSTYSYETQGIDYTTIVDLTIGTTCCTRSSRFYNSNTPYIQQLTRYDGLHAGQVGGGTYSHIGFCL